MNAPRTLAAAGQSRAQPGPARSPVRAQCPPAARPRSGRGTGHRARAGGGRSAYRVPALGPASRGDREKEQGVGSRAGGAQGSGSGQASGTAGAARARRGRRAARRVRGRRGRAGRCVLVGQFRARRYVAARQPSRDGRPRPQSLCPHPPPAHRQWPQPAGAGSHRPRPRPRPRPLPAAPPASSPRPFPAAATATARAPGGPAPSASRPASGLHNGQRGHLDRGKPEEGPETPYLAVPPPSPLPSPSRSPRYLSPATLAHSQRRVLFPRALSEPGYLLPTEYQAEGWRLPRPGRGRDLRLPLSKRREDPSSWGWAREEAEGERRRAARTQGRPQRGGRRVAVPSPAVLRWQRLQCPARLPWERDGRERGGWGGGRKRNARTPPPTQLGRR